MSFTIPTAVLMMQTDWDLDARARGVITTQPGTRNTKAQGSLPLTGSNATAFVHNSDGNIRGVWWEFLATGGYDVSTNTRLMVGNWQFNAPNRIEHDTLANDGFFIQLGCGTGSPPTVWRRWVISGNDSVGGQARENPKMFVIDLSDDSYDSSSGSWDNTDIECWGSGGKQAHIGGTTMQWFFARLFILETTKNATNIPRFAGASSDWDDIITAMGTGYSSKITDEWLKREGIIFSLACPIEIGNNSTITTFNDGGASVFWSNHNDSGDPRVRITENAFRVYLNLRNNAADTATFSGYYDAGNSYPPWDFDQDDSAVVTFNSPTFNRTGTFDVGSSITGPATFNDCGVVTYKDSSVDLDGSTFKNPHGSYLVELP